MEGGGWWWVVGCYSTITGLHSNCNAIIVPPQKLKESKEAKGAREGERRQEKAHEAKESERLKEAQ